MSIAPKIEEPTESTLKRYGLDLAMWRKILARQNGVCRVCCRVPKSRRLVIDHEHVTGWKKMPPEERRKYVRGLLCWFDNHYALTRGMTIEKAQNVVVYLTEYAIRRDTYLRLP